MTTDYIQTVLGWQRQQWRKAAVIHNSGLNVDAWFEQVIYTIKRAEQFPFELLPEWPLTDQTKEAFRLYKDWLTENKDAP